MQLTPKIILSVILKSLSARRYRTTEKIGSNINPPPIKGFIDQTLELCILEPLNHAVILRYNLRIDKSHGDICRPEYQAFH